MQVVDRFGNRLEEGSTVVWMIPGTQGLMATVAKISEGGVVLPGRGPKPIKTHGKFVLQVMIDLPSEEESKGSPVAFQDMIKSFARESDGILRSLLSE